MPRVSGAVAPWHEPSWAESPTGQRAASSAARATSVEVARMQCGLPMSIFSLFGVVICSIGVGSQYMPSLASVAYAFAMSSGVDEDTPRVKEPQPDARAGEACKASDSARNCTPNRLATATTFSAPTRSSSGTKKVLTELPRPVHKL